MKSGHFGFVLGVVAVCDAVVGTVTDAVAASDADFY
jgi:hypothetical protein